MTIANALSNCRRLVPAVALTAACRHDVPPRLALTDTAAAVSAAAMSCDADALRPVAAAPASGLWVGGRATPATRVAAMIGPSLSTADRARITRRVETVEERAGSRPIRLASDTASVRLELLPPYASRGGTGRRASGGEPAAVYAISQLVLLASYEPCEPSLGEPRLRYLRRDDRGAVALDLMLRRDSADVGRTHDDFRR